MRSRILPGSEFSSQRFDVMKYAVFVLGMTSFCLAYGQAPLYYSNQNQYFLHGLANADRGFLSDDWLAKTADPTPVFSGLVAMTIRFLHPLAFHLYYAVLMGVYFASLLGIFTLATGQTSWRQQLVFTALLILVHSAALRWLSYRLLGWDYPWYLQAGVAGQYVLGAMFQPSTFGVLLILAICLFGLGRPFAAVGCTALAATLHSTYLLGAAILTSAFMFTLWRQGKPGRALSVGGACLVLVLPVMLFVYSTFRPTSVADFVQAQQVLVHFRIPHHSLPQLWFDAVAAVQIGLIVLSLALVYGTVLFPVLTTTFALSAALTLLQVVTGSDTLALLFPWRMSIVLMPVATTVVLGRLVAAAGSRLDNAVAATASGTITVLAVAGGLCIMMTQQAFQSSVEEIPMMRFVKDNVVKGDLYLIPVQLPNLKATTRGSQSSDYKPLAAKKSDARLIPVDLQRFRLSTGAPIFVDFKSIPYKDSDVLEWRKRLGVNQRILEHLTAGEYDDAIAALREHGITHLVIRADIPLDDSRLQRVHGDAVYQVVRSSVTCH